MTLHKQPLAHSHYVKALKDSLPPQAFAAQPQKLGIIAFHIAILCASYFGIRASLHIGIHALLSLCIGHSLTCIGFLAHELSHKAIVRKSSIRYPLELLLFGLIGLPATMWQLLHNQLHHVYGNTIHDPDRYYLKSEVQPPEFLIRRWYTKLFFPHPASPVWNPLVWIHFVTYIARNLVAVFYPDDRQPSIVTNKPNYSNVQRLRIFFEIACIVLLQYAIFIIVGSRWEAFLWASPIALLFTSTFVMAYIWTNHYLHGLYEIHDPVTSSTSVIVHPLFDRLHSHFSYHTEHHIFPSMNSDFYPQVSELLQQKFPDRYNRIPIKNAWQQLFSNKPYID